ncbi:MAG: hypothetical protein KatS3mg024_1494 [Armatimonadota bacterium]|nr:MAG: hypothetical protein KatS3mg024_1494 [Armatimonadota bacterium]
MNIAIFASAFYPHVGGVEELCRQLALESMRKGHRVIILTNRWPRSLPEHEELEGIPVYRLPFRVPDGSLKAHVSYHLTHRQIVRRMLGILRKHAVDVLHVQCISSNGYYAMVAKQAMGLPLVVTAQGELTMDASGIYQRSGYMRRTLRRILNVADAITACSRATLQELEEWYATPFGERAEVIHNGIRLADFQDERPLPERPPFILGIGRMVPQKGFDLLIEAFRRAGTADMDLLVAGDGPELAALKELAAASGLDGRVLFPGKADRQTAAALFRECAFFVLPSRHEPFGIVNLEAMAAGKAVLATRVGGVPEVVLDGETGILVPPEDVDALAEGIRRLAGDPSLRERLGAAGRERAELFSWDAVTEKYLMVYRKVCAGGKGAPADG